MTKGIPWGQFCETVLVPMAKAQGVTAREMSWEEAMAEEPFEFLVVRDRELEELRAENARLRKLLAIEGLSCKVAADIDRLKAKDARLRAVLEKLQWKSVDKDNMEFRCDITCYVMDEIRLALGA